MAAKVLGYNILFRQYISAGVFKVFGGTTSNSFDLTAITKESITKEDAGTKQQTVTGYEAEFSVEGLVEINAAGDTTTRIDKDTLIGFILNKTVISFYYGTTATGNKQYSGSAICTKYSESSNSEDEATYSASFKLSGALTVNTNS